MAASSSAQQAEAQQKVTLIEHLGALDIYSTPSAARLTAIICTIGPKTSPPEELTKLREAGMNVVRMNFSHGSYEYHQSIIDNLHKSCADTPGLPVALALDTKGPEIRTGNNLNDADISLEKNQLLTVTIDPAHKNACTKDLIYVDYTNIVNVIRPGSYIFLDDGLISLEVLEVAAPNIKVKVFNEGKISSRRGVNLPGTPVDLPAVSEKDAADLRFGVKNKVDMVFASFIRKASDVREIRSVLGEDGKHILVIAKIENHEGMRNFDEILAEADGIMVARGDLGIEIPAEKVFLAQKMMISRCNMAGKPVICATQMLESMTFNPRPTRAEASDVANAVLDGADCVMLSGETAKGSYPIQTVRMMHNICKEAESAIFYGSLFNELRAVTMRNLADFTQTEAVCCAAVNATQDASIGAIICVTKTGTNARLCSKYRPKVPILAVTRDLHIAKICHLYRGCVPCYIESERSTAEWQDDVDQRIDYAIECGKRMGLLQDGQKVIAVQGWRGGAGHTNTMRVLPVTKGTLA